MRLTVASILDDFENQKNSRASKFCPLIQEICNTRCYNYYHAKIHVTFQLDKRSQSLVTDDIEEVFKKLSHVKFDDIKTYNFMPEGCTYWDYYEEMPSILSQLG